MNSLHHPQCKTRTKLSEVLLTLKEKKKKNRLCQTDWRGKQQNISCILSVFLLSVNFSFVFPQPEGTREWREGKERWEEMCFSRVHIKCTWKTTAPQRIMGYPPGPTREAMTDVYIQYLPFWDLMYTKTIQWGYFFIFKKEIFSVLM